MNNLITLYHGSESIISKPTFGVGRINNDFGLGFYCTQSNEMAKEWAVSNLKDGYSNQYLLDTNYLKILNLNSLDYSILNWIAILVQHRVFTIKTPQIKRAKDWLINNYGINVNAWDLIIGYRADDSYYDFAQAFISNQITVDQLAIAMKLGSLGEQIVLKSQFAFSKIRYVDSQLAKAETYSKKKRNRNQDANSQYWSLLEKQSYGLYIQDIIRKDIKNEDSRIPRNVSI